MLEVLKVNRMRKLMQQYASLKEKAKNFMQAGDLQRYIQTISKANEIKALYLNTARMVSAA